MLTFSDIKLWIKHFKLSVFVCCITFFSLRTFATNNQSQYETTLNVIYFENSKWTLDELQTKYKDVISFYHKCNLKIKVNFIRSSHVFSETPIFYGNNETGSTDLFAESLPDLPNTIYINHVDSLKDEQGRYTEAISAPSIRISNVALTHKNWISFPNAEKNLIDSGNNLGITEAHELAHDLFNSDHVPGYQNILSTFGTPKWNITDEQCKKLLSHPKVFNTEN